LNLPANTCEQETILNHILLAYFLGRAITKLIKYFV